MARPVTLFTGQWADLPLDTVCEKAKSFGYDGVELACWGDHFEVAKADAAYCKAKRELLASHGLQLFSISTHLVGQAVCDLIDERHQAILPDYVWGDGDPEGVRQRAAEEIIRTGEAAARLGVEVVNGFTGSSIWHLLYSFPPVTPQMIDAGFADLAARWIPILDALATKSEPEPRSRPRISSTDLKTLGASIGFAISADRVLHPSTHTAQTRQWSLGAIVRGPRASGPVSRLIARQAKSTCSNNVALDFRRASTKHGSPRIQVLK